MTKRMKQQLKKSLPALLRLLIAAAGIGYIAWSVVWIDQVVLPAGTELPGGAVLGEEVEAAVVEQDRDEGTLLLDMPEPSERAAWPDRVELPADRLTAGETGPRFEPGVTTMLAGADFGLLGVGLVLLGLMLPIQAARWHLLLRCRGLDPGFGRSFRLTMVGLFFNFLMPGMTGGDVVKGYYAAKGSDRKGAAVMSVIFDRVTGLVAMVLLAAVAGLMMLEEPVVRQLTGLSWAVLLGLLVAAGAYFSPVVRRRLGVQRLLDKLSPMSMLVRIDQAALAYREQKLVVAAAVGISLPAHLAQMTATALAGYALGIELPLVMLLTVLPVVFFTGSLPISPQGLGVMEVLAVSLLATSSAASANQVLGMILMARVFLIFYALIGALMMLRGDIRLFPAGEETASADAPPAPAPA